MTPGPAHPRRTPPVVDVDQAAHTARLTEDIAAGRQPPAGRLLGLPELPDDVWVDIAGAEALTGIPARTITGWLTRGGPTTAPFPPPHRYLYRLYWPRTTVLNWLATYQAP